MLKFVEKALNKGENVLIHCLAGAHRAGTTSIINLMHFENLGADKAIKLAKSIRPVIDPISNFPQLLYFFESYRKASRAGSISDPILNGNATGTTPKAAAASASNASNAGFAIKASESLRNQADMLSYGIFFDATPTQL